MDIKSHLEKLTSLREWAADRLAECDSTGQVDGSYYRTLIEKINSTITSIEAGMPPEPPEPTTPPPEPPEPTPPPEKEKDAAPPKKRKPRRRHF
jgi:hypothetical protein